MNFHWAFRVKSAMVVGDDAQSHLQVLLMCEGLEVDSDEKKKSNFVFDKILISVWAFDFQLSKDLMLQSFQIFTGFHLIYHKIADFFKRFS